jgi:hypothetical protein
MTPAVVNRAATLCKAVCEAPPVRAIDASDQTQRCLRPLHSIAAVV